MTDLSQIPDRELVLEIYRRIRGDDEMSLYRNYCYRAAFRPIYISFDRANIDEANVRMWKEPNWDAIEAERDDALTYFPD